MESVSYTHLDVYKRQAVLSGQSIRLVTTLHSLTNLRVVAQAEIKFAIEIKDQPKKALEGIAVFLYYFN